jgi:hypothetical protein
MKAEAVILPYVRVGDDLVTHVEFNLEIVALLTL